MGTRKEPALTCPECGAPAVDGMSCFEQLAWLIGWEQHEPELRVLHHHLLLSQDLEPVLIGIATEGLVDVALLIRHRTDGYTQFSEDLIDVFKTEVERVDLDELEAGLYAEGALQLVRSCWSLS